MMLTKELARQYKRAAVALKNGEPIFVGIRMDAYVAALRMPGSGPFMRTRYRAARLLRECVREGRPMP